MNAEDPTAIIDLPAQSLDKVVEILAKVGIDLPVMILQLFLLALVLLALFIAVRAVLPDWRKAALPALFAAATLVLVVVGILFGMVAQMLLPNRLAGRVGAADLTNVRVELLDFRGESISTGGSVDSQSGEFFAYYKPAWFGRARALRISAAGCRTTDQPIARGQLTTEVVWEFVCEKV
jgi:hypothetical protein